jgi:multiple antibiotic resistance protein
MSFNSPDVLHFVHTVFIGFIALFPVVNPIGTSFIVSPYLTNLSQKERSTAVKKITIYVFIVCAITLFTGHYILALFGLTVPVIKLAGGVIICKIGYDILFPSKTEDPPTTESEDNNKINIDENTDINSKLFYPITFPMTAGAGALSVLFTLSAHGSSKDISVYLVNTAAILIAVIGICILVFITYVNANRIISFMGSKNEKIINSIMAFLIFCVGLQIAVGGIYDLVKVA